MKGVPGLVRTGQHGPGGVARGVAGLNPINIKQEPSGGAVQEAPGVYLLCTTIYLHIYISIFTHCRRDGAEPAR